VIAEWQSWAAVALAVLGALAAAAIWPGSAHVAAGLISPLRDIYLTGVDLRSTLQNPQVRQGSGPPRPTLAAGR
jgi:hypothetical protein